MTATAQAHTYFPAEQASAAEIINILDALQQRSSTAPEATPYLVAKDGKHYQLPDNLFEPLLLIAQSLLDGKAVTVAPQEQNMTTQEAADFLGISRPTLVKLLERGEIPFEKISRHRRVKLGDLVAYQENRHLRVREALNKLSEAEYRDGIFEATMGIPPAMR
ncbi:MAG: helix-turn-helix domain-containing protein [Rothia sp. (in: high G+C Gram-positive bacteria)]|nr:helix-turn-helix domain-containing protein [Rothia sp. (in: high G+C Gram-positive bacteria)]